jgi:hypothetical protein
LPVILATWKAEIGRIVVTGQPEQKVNRTPYQPISGHSGVCLFAQLHRRLGWGRSWFQAILGKKKKKIVCETPSQQKKAGSGGMYMSSQQLWEV